MDSNTLLDILKVRFEQNMHRHASLSWEEVMSKIDKRVLNILDRMESSGGEPDVMQFDDEALYFVDFSKESPLGRRSLCYDQKALDGRKANKPEGDVLRTAKEIGGVLLSEDDYRQLQKIEAMDLKTSSWIETSKKIRDLGGALFCDRRYNTVFTYHNGAESYYGARGFRLKIKI